MALEGHELNSYLIFEIYHWEAVCNTLLNWTVIYQAYTYIINLNNPTREM